MQQLTSLIVWGYDRSRWERLQRAQHVAATISWMPPRDCDGHRTANAIETGKGNGRVHIGDDLVIPCRATAASQPYNS